MSSEETVHPVTAAVQQYRDTLNEISRDWETIMQNLDREYPARGQGGAVYETVPANPEHAAAYQAEFREIERVYNEAGDAYNRDYQALNEKYPARGRGGSYRRVVPSNAEHAVAWRTGHTAAVEQDRARREVAKTAVTTSEHKLAVWLVESGALDQYPDHVTEVLSWFPASYEELVEKGSHTGWCNEFTRYLNLAHRAGVLEDDRNAKEQLLGKLRRAGRLSDSTRQLVEAALAEAVAEALAAQDPTRGQAAAEARSTTGDDSASVADTENGEDNA